MAHLLPKALPLIILLTTLGPVLMGVGSEVDESWSRTSSVGRLPSASSPLPAREQAMVDWAMGRFVRAGLELPVLRVRFDPSRELCRGKEGRYHHEPAGEKVVTICAPDRETFGAELQARRTLLHEFGHAWDVANLSDEDHAELALSLGSGEWNNPENAWAERGVERLAETFVFALLDQPHRALKMSLDCPVALGAFHAATGADPLGPGLPACAA